MDGDNQLLLEESCHKEIPKDYLSKKKSPFVFGCLPIRPIYWLFMIVAIAGIGRMLLALLLLFTATTEGTINKVLTGETVANVKGTNLTLSWETDFYLQRTQFKLHFGENTPDGMIIVFTPDGSLDNTDAIFYNRLDNYILDGYIRHDGYFARDTQQDIKFLMFQSDHILFSRKLVTCDSKDYAFQAGTTQLIIGASYSLPEHLDSSMHSHHWFWDKKFVKIVEANTNENIPAVKMERDATVAQITASGRKELPAIETFYSCTVRQMPYDTVNKKHHIVRMEAYVQPGNEHLVHHMEVFLCQSPDVEAWNGDCNDPNKPVAAKSCSHVIAAWAMGEGPIIYPEEAGLPLGGRGRKEYIMVEIHYNNPNKIAHARDQSGFTFYVTPTLREHDAGIMELGLIYSDANSIPPGQRQWAMNGYCPIECTQNLPEEGINIFASQLHAHLTGRKLWTSHYRNGVKIGEINRDEHYSPHWQHVQMLKKHINVLPGDTLTTTCVYDTRERLNVTFGGYGITDEMCVNYVYYYPASEVEVCKSAVSNTTLRSYFENNYGANLHNESISSLYKMVRWTKDNVEAIYNTITSGHINMHCLKHDGSKFPFTGKDETESWEFMQRPTVFSGAVHSARDMLECPAINDLINFD